MIDRVNLSANERAVWLAAFAHASRTIEFAIAARLHHATRYAVEADKAVAAYRELKAYDKPREP